MNNWEFLCVNIKYIFALFYILDLTTILYSYKDGMNKVMSENVLDKEILIHNLINKLKHNALT